MFTLNELNNKEGIHILMPLEDSQTSFVPLKQRFEYFEYVNCSIYLRERVQNHLYTAKNVSRNEKPINNPRFPPTELIKLLASRIFTF